ncbi:hypothetical protein [Nocardia barduliensis]|uniref:hypothetical protein n=1 Tax=Nocardia barduliensis TaxID=2736643 RepID=UPI001571F205|nr:hypothetical protein [Nocardia barduliensis]
MKLCLITTAHDMPIAWCLADPRIGEREVAAELIGHAHDRAMLPLDGTLIGDKRLAGNEFHHLSALVGVHFLRPDRKGEPHRSGDAAASVNSSNRSTTPAKDNSPSKPRRTHSRRPARPNRPAPTRPGRRDLAKPHHQRPTSRSLTAYDH